MLEIFWIQLKCVHLNYESKTIDSIRANITNIETGFGINKTVLYNKHRNTADMNFNIFTNITNFSVNTGPEIRIK